MNYTPICKDLYRRAAGSKGVEMWHAAQRVQSSAGVIGGWNGAWRNTPQAPVSAAPAFAADGTHFGSRPVLQCAIAGAKSLTSGVLSPAILANTTRPCVIARARVRTASVALQTIATIGVTSSHEYLQLRTSQSAGATLDSFSSFTGTTTGPASDTAVHTLVSYLDGTNQVLTVDGVVYVHGSTGTIDAITTVNLGSGVITAGGQVGDVSIALYMLLTAYPGAAAIADISALAAADFAA